MSERTKMDITPGKKVDIPVEGALGIMALGYKGYLMWREVRDEAVAKMKDQKENDTKENEQA
ncbi:MAG: hypothetical protein K1X56_03810 [Flavobacteriales bacterium]|nr:hypothetical protein [Flavobacteriales bacterium]